MPTKQAIAVFALLAGCAAASAQQTSQVELKIEATNRMLAASAEERVTADPEIAILHIGFETQPSDAKTAYAVGARISNNIVSALKQAGIPETSIRSEWQQLESASGKLHKFNLIQEWTVKTPPERAAEILDIAVSAGATDSGQIDWTVKDEKALEEQALALPDRPDSRLRRHSDAGLRLLSCRTGRIRAEALNPGWCSAHP